MCKKIQDKSKFQDISEQLLKFQEVQDNTTPVLTFHSNILLPILYP